MSPTIPKAIVPSDRSLAIDEEHLALTEPVVEIVKLIGTLVVEGVNVKTAGEKLQLLFGGRYTRFADDRVTDPVEHRAVLRERPSKGLFTWVYNHSYGENLDLPVRIPIEPNLSFSDAEAFYAHASDALRPLAQQHFTQLLRKYSRVFAEKLSLGRNLKIFS